MSRLTRAVRTIIKDISLKAGRNRQLFSLYPYMFSPAQLIFLADCITSVTDVPGSCVEIGCAYGATTVFLNKFMNDNAQLVKRNYYAIDTFQSFVAEHADYEIQNRGKPPSIKKRFKENKRAWFDKSMAVHDVKRVKSIECDATQFDLSSLAPIAFCLIDVDLYIPVKELLPKVFSVMSSGGIIIVDDCQPDQMWDGALQAYQEFTRERHLPAEIVLEKLGIVRPP
jgi:predicted O-methyltransferase YrrM